MSIQGVEGFCRWYFSAGNVQYLGCNSKKAARIKFCSYATVVAPLTIGLVYGTCLIGHCCKTGPAENGVDDRRVSDSAAAALSQLPGGKEEEPEGPTPEQSSLLDDENKQKRSLVRAALLFHPNYVKWVIEGYNPLAKPSKKMDEKEQSYVNFLQNIFSRLTEAEKIEILNAKSPAFSKLSMEKKHEILEQTFFLPPPARSSPVKKPMPAPSFSRASDSSKDLSNRSQTATPPLTGRI